MAEPEEIEAEEEEDDEDVDVEIYEPQSLCLMDGSVSIHDEVAWAEEMNALATQFVGGDLFVLRRDTRKWMKVEPFPETTAVRAIKTVQ
jgi:hypothetical protein